MTKLRMVVATVAVGAVLMAMPSGASAADQCLFQSTKVTAQNEEQIDDSLLCLTNLYRVRSGLSPIPMDTRLQAAAHAHSADMHARGFFDHFTPEGAGPPARAMAFGYPTGANEVIATNVEGTAQKLLDQWQHSPPHNEALLTPDFRAIGVGVVKGCCPAGPEGSVGTEMLGLTRANTEDTGFDLFASSDKCAKAKLARVKILAKPRKKRSSPAARERLRRLNRSIAKICKPPA